MFSRVDLFMLELVNRFMCWLWLIGSSVLMVWMLMFSGWVIGLCVSGLIEMLVMFMVFLVWIGFLLFSGMLLLLMMCLSRFLFIFMLFCFSVGIMWVFGSRLCSLVLGIR